MVSLQDPGEIDLVKTTPVRDSLRTRHRQPLAVIALLVVAALIAVATFVYLRRTRSQAGQPAGAAPADAVKLRQEPVAVAPLPPLDQIDTLVRELVRGLSTHPVVAAWLTTDGLIVNFVTVTSRIADGQSPVAELKPIGPVAPFEARAGRGTFHMDTASYHRYDRYAQAVAALDAGGTARVYETLKPRINEADRQFGGAGTFDVVLERAIVELLKVPIVSGDIALKEAGIGYAFVDPSLESLSPAQKHLLRMGPENVRTIQHKLREIAVVLGIPADRLPP